MSLEYFLFCKKRYEQIISNLNDIIDKYTEVDYATYIEDKLDNKELATFEPHTVLSLFVSKREHVKRLKKICDEKIRALCSHEFIDDYVDLSPECSQKISYCSICESTK